LKSGVFLTILISAIFIAAEGRADLGPNTGLRTGDDLLIRFSTACVQSVVPGPYSVRVRMFSTLFDRTTSTYLKPTTTPIQTIFTNARTGAHKFAKVLLPFETNDEDSVSGMKALPEVLPNFRSQEFLFENFAVKIPVMNLEIAAGSLPTPFSSYPPGREVKILGLEISIVNSSLIGIPEMLTSYVAFNPRQSPLADHLTADIAIDAGIIEPLIHQLSPYIAVLHSDQRLFLSRKGQHVDPQLADDCSKGSSLRYQIDLLPRP